MAFPDHIEESPSDWLSRIGHVFAEFGAKTQDSGNVSYGVQIGEAQYFVKTAGDLNDPAPYLSHGDRVGLLRNAVRVARSCSHSSLPTLRRVIESPIGPMLVYDWRDGERIGVPRERRHDPQSSYERFRHLPPALIFNVLDTLYDLHRELARLGWIAVDFYDGSLLYNFATHRLSVIDLDNYHPGPFVNTMGRMFGSSRFMAPEEFELGAIIDERTNVFVMGRAAALFLGDGTLSRAAFRGPVSLHRVIVRACEAEPSARFQSIAEFYDAWQSA
jgi:serine/threonine protein kinase, bacterial